MRMGGARAFGTAQFATDFVDLLQLAAKLFQQLAIALGKIHIFLGALDQPHRIAKSVLLVRHDSHLPKHFNQIKTQV